MLQELGNALTFLILAAMLPPTILFVSRFLRPQLVHAAKEMPYECGEPPRGPARIMFNNRFYLVAIIFLVFDVEVALLFPVLSLLRGAALKGEALPIVALSAVFMLILLVGLVYEWKRGDIDWFRDVKRRGEEWGRVRGAGP